jgi:hypothetical protein
LTSLLLEVIRSLALYKIAAFLIARFNSAIQELQKKSQPRTAQLQDASTAKEKTGIENNNPTTPTHVA